MECKELIFKKVILVMSSVMNKENLELLKRTLVKELEGYEIYEKENKELPAVYTERNVKLIEFFLGCKRIEGKSEKTIASYENTLKTFLNYFDVDLLTVDTNTFRMFFIEMEKRGNCSVSMDNKRRKLNAFYNFLVEEDIIKKNPLRKMGRIKQEQKIKTPYSEIEIAKLKEACKTKREKAYIDLLLTTGIRNDELCSIKLNDIDFINKSIIINGKGAKQRFVYLNERCVFHLQDYLNEREMNCIESEYLFCNERRTKVDGELCYKKLNPNNFNSIVKKLTYRANIKNGYVHRFRRTFCCNLLEVSDLITAQTLMGHSKIETTRGYACFNEQRARYEHSKLKN